MKRFLSITTVIFLLISLTACGKSDTEEELGNSTKTTSEKPYNKEATIQLDEIDIDSIDFLQVDLGEMISTDRKSVV